jgi:WD40 repeat protein
MWDNEQAHDKLISGSNTRTIKVWDTETWACEHTLEGHDKAVN